MSYEIFLWLEPIARIVTPLFSFFGCFGIAVGYFLAAMFICTSNDEDSEWGLVAPQIRTAASSIKKVSAGLLIVGLLSSPISTFSDVYKKILIYRGINSTLVEKGVGTADKALEVLNAKLDKELLNMKKAEKE